MSYRYILIFSVALLILSCEKRNQPSISVPFSEIEINVDGVVDEDVWEQAVLIKYLDSHTP